MYLSEAADRLNLHPNTLLQYENLGLHEPERHPGNNYRLYDEADLAWIRCIREMIHEEGYQRRSLARALEVTNCWTFRGCTPEQRDSCKWAQKLKEDNHA